MKKRLLCLLCTVSLLLGLVSLPPSARAVGDTVTLALTVTATQGTTAVARSLTDLRAGDTVTANIATTAEISRVNTLTVGLDFDKSYFTCTDVDVSGLGSQYIVSSHTAGWNLEKITSISDVNTNGFVVANGTQYLDSSENEANRSMAANTVLLSVTFTVKSGVNGAAVPFGVRQNIPPVGADLGSTYLQFTYLEGSQPVPCTVTSPASVPATVVEPLSSVSVDALTIAAGSTAVSSVSGTNCSGSVSWTGVTAGGTIPGAGTYTAVITLTPGTGYVFTDSAAVSYGGTTLTSSGQTVNSCSAQISSQSTGSVQITVSRTIDKAAANIQIDTIPTLVYDGGAVTAGTSGTDILYSYTGDGTVAINWYADNSGSRGSPLSGAPTNAGTYWVGVSAAAGTDYAAVSEVTRPFTISRAASAGITVASNQSSVYDGGAVTAGTAAADILYSYTGDGTVAVNWYADNSGSHDSKLSGAPTNAGTYWIGVSAAAGANFDAVPEVFNQFVITQAAAAISVAAGQSVGYSGSPVTAGTSGALRYSYNGDGAITVNWYADSSGSLGSNLSAAPSAAGTYWIGVSAAAGTNYTAAAEVQQRFTISQVGASISIAPSQTAVYDGGAVTAGTSGADIIYAYNGDGAVTVNWYADSSGSRGSSLPAAPTNAGTYWVGVEAAAGTNFAKVSEVPGKFVISKKSVTVSGITADSKVYDGLMTASLNCSGAVFSGKADGDSLTVTATGAFSDKNAGTNKTVTISGLSLGGGSLANYVLSGTGNQSSASAAITPKALDAADFGFSSGFAVSKVYDGTTGTAAATVVGSITNSGILAGDSVTVTPSAAAYDGEGVGSGKTVLYSFGTGTALSGTAAANYSYTPSDTTKSVAAGSITPAGYSYTIGSVVTGLKVGSGTAAITGASSAGIGVTVSSVAEPVTGTLTWYRNSGRTQLLTDSDISGLSVGAAPIFYWSFAATDGNYTSASKTGSVQFTILAGDPQVLTFTAPASVAKTYGDAGFTNAITSVKTAAGADIADHGAITYSSSSPTVAAVDASTGAVTIKAAGSTVITAAAAAVAGKWEASTQSYSLTVSPKAASLTWEHDTDLVYDGTSKNVTASVSNLVSGDLCTVSVTGGTAKNAGSYTAAASALSNSNYALPASPTRSYTIAKASRGLANVPSSLTLTIGSLSQTLTPSFSNLDASASPAYTSYDSSVVTVSPAGKVTAVGNGTAAVTVSLAATGNYNDANAACSVTAIASPITKIASVTGGSGDALTAVLSGSTISVRGFATADQTITITPVYSTLASGDASITTTVTTAALAAGSTFQVTAGGSLVQYTVSYAGVIILPANVALEETAPATSVSGSIADDLKSAVTTALQNSATNADGLMAAAASALLSTAQNLSTTQASALAPLGENPKITVSVGAKIEALSYSGGNSLILEITPTYHVTASTTQVGNAADPVVLQSETTLPNSVITAPISVSISLPADFPVSNLFVRHTTSSGTEYLPVTVSDRTATWFQSSFSSVELYSDARSGSICYTFADGTVQTVSYDAGSLLTSLPTDSMNNSTFNGWTIGSTTYTTMTEALLSAVNGKTLTAASSFTANSSGGVISGGGGVSSGVTASIFRITATAVGSGSISPSGDVAVTSGKDRAFTITPDTGYRVSDVLVDGVSVGAVRTYTFSSVTAAHKISVTFVKGSDVTDLFTDIYSGIWCRDAVQYASDNGLMKGTSETAFSPDVTLNRGMLVTILYRLEGSPAASGGSAFSDVTSNTWCRDAVLWASSAGVVNGFGNGTFGADQGITRQQFVAILYRYAAYKGYDTGASASLSTYTDSEGLWAADAMRWALTKGILTGRTASTLAPDGAATRGQTATFLMRFLKNAAK